jgi:hypothetical protein
VLRLETHQRYKEEEEEGNTIPQCSVAFKKILQINKNGGVIVQ